jgi:UDP-N-acetylglucosamine--N-acetylmuramyl-(pentapeptide) pyrophosphoryl-undecaprenol N-acetylglucosamine transferase
MKKAVIFVPSLCDEDHQTVNAQSLAQNAGIMIKDGEALTQLVPLVLPGKGREQTKQLMNNIGKLAISNADEIIAKSIDIIAER